MGLYLYFYKSSVETKANCEAKLNSKSKEDRDL